MKSEMQGLLDTFWAEQRVLLPLMQKGMLTWSWCRYGTSSMGVRSLGHSTTLLAYPLLSESGQKASPKGLASSVRTR